MGRFSIFILSLLGQELLQVSASSQLPLLLPSDHAEPVPAFSYATQNAPKIFNTLYGAMRQWSSSIHHNGMSYFPVSIPANTLFYHGRNDSEPVKGLDWMSFEVEHAEYFARINIWDLVNNNDSERMHKIPPNTESIRGYLHTYRTTRHLTKLLYIDGQSAAKSYMGTLDTQDVVLLQNRHDRSKPLNEFQRLKSICDLSPHIEGVMRMEMGFEVVMCNVSDTMEHLSANQRPGLTPEERKREDIMLFGEYARGVSQRFWGIGGGRASVDFSSMVSAYFRPFNLTNPDPKRSELPRINPEQKELIEQLRSDVLALFGSQERQVNSIDWQGVTDMVITRYSDRLDYITSSEIGPKDMLGEIELLLGHYINYHSVNFTATQENCTSHYLLPVSHPRTSSDQLIYQAIATVTGQICQVLLKARDDLRQNGSRNTAGRVKQNIQTLTKWLSWSTWLECGKCAPRQVCYVAAWPWGSKKDHYEPGCLDVHEILDRSGYWDFNI